MATEVFTRSVGMLRGLGTAGGGLALDTAVSAHTEVPAFPPGTNFIVLQPRNFSTAVVAQFALNPWLHVLRRVDTTWTDVAQNAQDASTGTTLTLSSQDTAANSNFYYIGSHDQFRGVAVDVQLTNSTASVLTVKYWKNDSTWADITATDGTASGGATFAQDGFVTWTVPTDWQTASLVTAGDISAANATLSSQNDGALFWTRWEVSVALDASVTANSMTALNKSTAYPELVSGQVAEIPIHRGPGGIGAMEVKVDAGTGNIIIFVGANGPGGRFSN